jgi:hypothetical protein
MDLHAQDRQGFLNRRAGAEDRQEGADLVMPVMFPC